MAKTYLGKLSVKLIIAFFLFLAIFYLVIASGQRGGDTFFSNPGLAMPILLAGISGISSFVVGLMSIIKHKERSILVFIATAIGLFVLWFALAEILYPH